LACKMPVDVNDIIIFKARGMTAKPAKQQAPAEAMKQEEKPQVEAQVQPVKPQAAKPTIVYKPSATAQEGKKTNEEELAEKEIQEEVKKLREEEERLEREQEMEVGEGIEKNYEALAAGGAAPGAKKTKVKLGTFSAVAGATMIFDAALFAFFIYPQIGFLMSYISTKGIMALLSNLNYSYGITLLNFVVLAAMGVLGVLMLARTGRVYMFAGGIATTLLILASFEYLSSNANYLAIVSVVTFISIGAIAYSRMSAVTVEEENQGEEEIVWPRIETF